MCKFSIMQSQIEKSSKRRISSLQHYLGNDCLIGYRNWNAF